MSKYARLGEYLKHQSKEQVPMTFAEIERIARVKLPRSSRYRAWWSNNDFNSVMTKVWLAAGYKSEQVDMEARKLVFRRVHGPNAGPPPPDEAGSDLPFHPLYGAMKGLVRVMPGADLTQPADPDWADRLDQQFAGKK